MALHEGRELFAFTTPGDTAAQEFARRLGAQWAGGSDETPPKNLDAAIIFAPVGPLVPAALRVLERGGIVVCGGIHMSDIPSFPYHDLWQERTICSVANLTRRDGEEFLALAPRVPIRTETQTFPLERANDALHALRTGALTGAAVLVPDWLQRDSTQPQRVRDDRNGTETHRCTGDYRTKQHAEERIENTGRDRDHLCGS